MSIIVPSQSPSKPQIYLYEIVRQRYLDAEIDFYVDTLETFRFIDIAIPSLMIAIEYNGWLHHHGEVKRKADRARKSELEDLGWHVITCTKLNVLRFIAYMPMYCEDRVILKQGS